ncbi:hypothetical protein NEAUS04_1241 [Nematocida ausubeli]|uniref:Uncharacterized protein n=1 Tax=Nematocida ausubeli (strain ATCC PRA-371 / ERTm2) TaxID=1913371 RepID=H8ZF13_NEMA1|nr:hypothetical protein NERG_02182 [Nematocida ausubeli]KAI5133829.1 hypothetical protein NEAUS06_0766 [Nematocida ausubeli]KAI5135643.1 hypothetical protein NEAUS07_1269 [Nematocida ausubeli]KAI5146580.1 hypothetical protein NEAUS05_0028 [Nematocida ausubeli]KAI5162921.1 hypothetical protein NEAUS04_1241 [Nematocida ausubeli]
MERIYRTANSKQTNERIKEIVPELRKYAAQRVGGSETIRCLRDSLKEVGLKEKKRNTPYRHQKVERVREKTSEINMRESLREQGIHIKKKRETKQEKINAMKKKRKFG